MSSCVGWLAQASGTHQGTRVHSAHTRRQIFFIKPSSSAFYSVRFDAYILYASRRDRISFAADASSSVSVLSWRQNIFCSHTRERRMKNGCNDTIIDVNLTQAEHGRRRYRVRVNWRLFHFSLIEWNRWGATLKVYRAEPGARLNAWTMSRLNGEHGQLFRLLNVQKFCCVFKRRIARKPFKMNLISFQFSATETKNVHQFSEWFALFCFHSIREASNYQMS